MRSLPLDVWKMAVSARTTEKLLWVGGTVGDHGGGEWVSPGSQVIVVSLSAGVGEGVLA